MSACKGREPIILPLLSTEKINEIRKCFHYFKNLSRSRFSFLINHFLSPEKKLSAKMCAEIFREMDKNDDGVVDVVEFLDYILYECHLKRGIQEDTCGFMSPSYFAGIWPSGNKNLGINNIQLMPNKLKHIGCIRKIYHYNSSRLDTKMPESQKRGLYVTVIGKRGIGFWRPDLTMITDTVHYASSEVAEYCKGCSAKSRGNLKIAGRDATRTIQKYDKGLPEFDIICMDDFQLIACYQILGQSLLFYDAKLLELRCSLTDLPLGITCSDYVPNRDGVSRLYLGGFNGGFYIIEFTSSVDLFMESTGAKNYKFQEVCQSDPSHFRVHHVPCHKNGYLTKIKFFYHVLIGQNFVISSSMFDDTHPNTCRTLAAIKFTVQAEHPKFIKEILQPIYFPVLDSVNTFAVDEEDGYLVSGGWDTLVRVWHLSDLNTKERVFRCHAELQGHLGFIIGVHFHSVYCQIISMSIVGTINVWNYLDGSIIQSYNCAHLMPRMHKYISSYDPKNPDIPPAFYFCKKTETIFIGEESLIVIPFGDLAKETHFTSKYDV